MTLLQELLLIAEGKKQPKAIKRATEYTASAKVIRAAVQKKGGAGQHTDRTEYDRAREKAKARRDVHEDVE